MKLATMLSDRGAGSKRKTAGTASRAGACRPVEYQLASLRSGCRAGTGGATGVGCARAYSFEHGTQPPRLREYAVQVPALVVEVVVYPELLAALGLKAEIVAADVRPAPPGRLNALRAPGGMDNVLAITPAEPRGRPIGYF